MVGRVVHKNELAPIIRSRVSPDYNRSLVSRVLFSPPRTKGGSRAMLLGGARTVGGGGCELDGAKRRRASATEAARSACRGSCGRGLGAQK